MDGDLAVTVLAPCDESSVKALMRTGRDTVQIAREYGYSEADIWNCLARTDQPTAPVIPSTQEMHPMSQPRYDSRVKVRASEDGSSVEGYWHTVRQMVDASADALVAVYGANCWARHEYVIYPDGLAFMQSAVNPYVHATASP